MQRFDRAGREAGLQETLAAGLGSILQQAGIGSINEILEGIQEGGRNLISRFGRLARRGVGKFSANGDRG